VGSGSGALESELGSRSGEAQSMGGEDHIKIRHSAETMEAIEGVEGVVGVEVKGSEWSKEEEEELIRMMMDEERTARAEQAH